MSEDQAEYNARSEAAIQQKLASMFAANKDEVSIPKIYIDMTGDIEAAAVLDELMFWTLPKKGTGKTSLRVFKKGALWLAVRRKDWWDRKRLTERQADGAILKLLKMGLVEKEVFLFDGKPTVHLRMVMTNFTKLYGDKMQEIAGLEEDENLTRDIADLYAMMGFPNETVKWNSPNGEMLNSPNGEFINSLQQPENNNSAGAVLTARDFQEAGEKVEKILAMSKDTAGTWQGRELMPPHLLKYADWWNSKTGQIMRKMNKEWGKAFNEWHSNELTIEALDEAYAVEVAWKKVIAKPSELTAKAIAIQALPKPDTTPTRPEHKPYIPEDDSQFVPRPS